MSWIAELLTNAFHEGEKEGTLRERRRILGILEVMLVDTLRGRHQKAAINEAIERIKEEDQR